MRPCGKVIFNLVIVYFSFYSDYVVALLKGPRAISQMTKTAESGIISVFNAKVA